MAISTNGTVLARVAGALYNTQMSNATYAEVAALDPAALVNTLYARDFSSSTDLAVATTLVTNLGLTSITGLNNWVAAQLTSAGSAKGAKVVDLLNSFAQMTADTTYGAFATAFNTKVDASLALSQTAGNKGGTFAAAGVVVPTAPVDATFALTTGIDALTGGAGNDLFSATHLTLGATDALVGGAGTDTLAIVDTGAAPFTVPSGTFSGIENVSIRNLNTGAVTAVTAVAQVTTITVLATPAAATDTAVVNYGGLTQSVVTGVSATTFGAAIAAGINALAGATIATAATGVVTITAPTAGTPLPAISLSNYSAVADAAGNTVVATTANRAAVTAVTSTDTVAATLFADATSFTSDNSTNAVSITGLTAAQSVTKNAGSGDLTAGFGATVTAGTVNINGGSTAGAVAITGSAFTTATINSTGAANTIGTLTGAATTTTATTINATTALTTGAATNLGATVTVNGAGNVSFGTTALESGVTTLNAAGLTGTLTVALGSAVTQKVTGGSGADVISSGAVLTTGSVDAGAGTDVLVLTSATHLASASLAAKYTNFETLRINTGITQDMGNAPASITALQTMGVATVSNMTPAQAASVQMRTNATAGTADALNLQLATQSGTADTLSIVAGVGTTTTGALDIAALNVTGFEVLNLQANPGPSSTAGAGGAGDRTTNITGTITGATLNTINLTGTAVNIANVAISGATAGVTINGSALTGDGLAAASQAGLTVAGSAFVGSTITGSGVRDVFTIGAEGSAYNGGGGNDRMTTTVAILVADGTTDGTMNGGDGTDTLVVSDTTTTLTDNHFTKLSNFEALTLSNTVGDASVTIGGTFNAAFATGATITTGTLAATKDITFAGGLASVPITITVDATLLTGAATDTNSITTGSAADTITFNTTAATYVGVAGAQGSIVIDAKAGNDTITFNHGQLLVSTSVQAVAITGGSGADTITKGSGSLNSTSVTSTTVFNMAAGDSGTTLATADRIVGFQTAGVAANTLSDVLNFEGTATVTAFSNSIDFGTILTHSVTGGIVTFDTAATFASAKVVNASNLADVVGYLNANMGVNETAGFLYDSNGDGANDATMVFHQGSSLTTVADDLVQLTGVTGLSLNATLTTVTAGTIAIA